MTMQNLLPSTIDNLDQPADDTPFASTGGATTVGFEGQGYAQRLAALQDVCNNPLCPVTFHSLMENAPDTTNAVKLGFKEAAGASSNRFRIRMPLWQAEQEFLIEPGQEPWAAAAAKMNADLTKRTKSNAQALLKDAPAWMPEAFLEEAARHSLLEDDKPCKGPRAAKLFLRTHKSPKLKNFLNDSWPLEVTVFDGEDNGQKRTLLVNLGRTERSTRLWDAKTAKTPEEAVATVIQDITDHHLHAYDLWLESAHKALASLAMPSGVSAAEWNDLLAESRLEIGTALIKASDVSWDAGLKASIKRLRKRVEWQMEGLHLELAARKARAALPEQLKDYYPLARSLGRSLKLVIGPTNSGKTHAAMQRLLTANSGVYLGPLRLLALELRDRLTEAGAPTSLVTGELIEEVEGARLSASTIEMLDFTEPTDVVVIDEVQMLADPQRGGVWLQALLGAPGREVWMLGSPEARTMVEKIAHELGEPLEVIEKRRLTPFTVDTKATPLGKLKPGSAVIAFSRRDVHLIASELRTRHKRTVSVIYGALSPEVRKEQARAFREGDNEILVATDAIGMGLNLPIAHVVFSTAIKWNGKTEEELDPHLLWQVAGRSGRFGHHDAGTVGALDAETLRVVQQTMARRPKAYVGQLNFEANAPIVDTIAKVLDTDSLCQVLQLFSAKFKHMESYRPYVSEETIVLARIVDRYDLPLIERFKLIHAPVTFRSGVVDNVFVEFVHALAHSRNRHSSKLVRDIRSMGQSLDAIPHDLESMEAQVKRLALYCWMHYRFPATFPDLQEAQRVMQELEQSISRSLTKVEQRTCRGCGCRLGMAHRFPVCDGCHHGTR